MAQEISEQTRDKIAMFQNLQNQLQLIMVQKQQLIIREKDIDSALEELGKMKKGRIYKMAGPILVESSLKESKENIKEEKEDIGARIQILERQEKKLSEKLKELGTELQGILQSSGVSAG